jgi:hypothetical protein
LTQPLLVGEVLAAAYIILQNCNLSLSGAKPLKKGKNSQKSKFDTVGESL